LHALDHNIHILDANQDLIINRLDTLAVQNAAIMSHFSITTDQHSLFLPTPTIPPKLQMKLQLSPFPITPFPSSASFEPNGWLNSYDPVTNTKGEPRKQAPPLKLNHCPFSDSNITARDFWIEYNLEREHGIKWRSDVKFKRLDGKSGTSLKATWLYRLPINAYMEFLIQMKGFTEDNALM
jgi:hypothetical protein